MVHLGFILGSQNHEKSIKNRVWNHGFLQHRFFRVFYWFLVIWGWFWEVLEGPKIEKNLKKIAFVARSDHDWSWDTILIAILNGFCRFKMDFGRLRWHFVEDFWMISNDCKRFRLQSLIWWLGRRGADQ